MIYLKRGSKGLEVERLQKALNTLDALRYPKLTSDGKFGPITYQWVTDFQKRHGLKVDGIVGPKTSAKLAYLLPSVYPLNNLPVTLGENYDNSPNFSPIPELSTINKGVVLLDTRIKPNAVVDSQKEILVKVDGNVSLENCITKVKTAADKMIGNDYQSFRLKYLTIMCHGLYTSHFVENDTAPINISPDWTEEVDENGNPGGVGGYGLLLAAKPLSLKTFAMTKDWFGKFEYIVILACGIAFTHPANIGQYGDGQLFCKKIAAATDAKIIAADKIQLFSPQKTWLGIPIAPTPTTPNFGKWEGKVYIFHPDGSFGGYSPTNNFPKTNYS